LIRPAFLRTAVLGIKLMQTNFSTAQLADPATASAAGVIRKCVHCGFCTATCPTYTLLGDELDSPRGRIYLMKEMLENDAVPTAQVVKHVDRCLSCLSCMTTCPSGVNYMHLVDHARAYIEQKYQRPWHERAIRALVAAILPYPGRLRLTLRLAVLGRPFLPAFSRIGALQPIAAMLALVPGRIPAARAPQPENVPAPARRVALLQGCAEPVLRPEIRAATLRLLARTGAEVVLAKGEVCCGALVHHLGREAESLMAARRNIDAWTREIDARGLDAIIVTASGCGTTIKDYGYMLREDPIYSERAKTVSALALDISEYLSQVGLPPSESKDLVVAYHSACSLQHGQKVTTQPVRLLADAGFTVKTPAEGHLCCGSAGTYNIFQSAIAAQLAMRKIGNLERLAPDVIAAGNIGCATQIALGTSVPVVHTVELLDWATGGPKPVALLSA
jgi:glycolate oxidase iron-sulfur subunit